MGQRLGLRLPTARVLKFARRCVASDPSSTDLVKRRRHCVDNTRGCQVTSPRGSREKSGRVRSSPDKLCAAGITLPKRDRFQGKPARAYGRTCRHDAFMMVHGTTRGPRLIGPREMRHRSTNADVPTVLAGCMTPASPVRAMRDGPSRRPLAEPVAHAAMSPCPFHRPGHPPRPCRAMRQQRYRRAALGAQPRAVICTEGSSATFTKTWTWGAPR